MSNEYNDTEGNSSDDVDLSTELNLGDDKDLDFEESFGDEALSELEQLARKAKIQGTRFSLKARRAIEDHLEERKLRKEMDYMFNDDFAADDDGSKK
jgi:hypothetical protein